jgi:hypothetical protein
MRWLTSWSSFAERVLMNAERPLEEAVLRIESCGDCAPSGARGCLSQLLRAPPTLRARSTELLRLRAEFNPPLPSCVPVSMVNKLTAAPRPLLRSRIRSCCALGSLGVMLLPLLLLLLLLVGLL